MLYGVPYWDMVVVDAFDVGYGDGRDVNGDVNGRVMWVTVVGGCIRGRLYGVRG